MNKRPCKCQEAPCGCDKPASPVVVEESYPIYIQSSNPTPELLAWIEKMSEDKIIYLQSGHPAHPPCGGPGQPACPPTGE